MNYVRFYRIGIVIVFLFLIIGCKNNDYFVISKKAPNQRYYGKIEEIRIYNSLPNNICLDLIIDNEILNLVKSMEIGFYLKTEDLQCYFYNFYRIDDNKLSICIYVDELNCSLDDKVLNDRERREEFFNKIEFYIVDNKIKKEYPIDLSKSMVFLNEVGGDYQRPL